MPKTYEIGIEQVDEIKEFRKSIKDKQTDKRFRAVQLRGEGKKNKEIAEILETTSDVVSIWVSVYAKSGAEALLEKKQSGNHRNMSVEQEAAILAEFEERANAGEMVEVSEI